MQPLISVDREVRQNSHRAEDAAPSPAIEENTPLLHRFPQNHYIANRNPITTVIVSLLLIFLIAGVIIGIYLLILQSNSENILPPVETPLQLVSRKQWDSTADSRPIETSSSVQTKQVVVVQTDTATCNDTNSCTRLLRNMQMNTTDEDKMLQYNFLVSTNGQTYESLGWHKPSHLFVQYPNTLVLGFIGNFTEIPPSPLQVQEAKNVFAESVSQKHLDPNYELIGRSTKNTPKHLFDSLKTLPQWNDKLSDSV